MDYIDFVEPSPATRVGLEGLVLTSELAKQ